MIEMQNQVKKFVDDKKLNTHVEIRMMDLVSEIGELSKEFLKGTNYGTEAFSKTESWECEIGDVLFSLILIANETHVNLEESLNSVLKKYEKRYSTKGHIGSTI